MLLLSEPEVLLPASEVGTIGSAAPRVIITADSGCSSAGNCSCSCVTCGFAADFMHCNNHGNGCHRGCSK
jgi:hypothetical protein